MPMTTLTQPVIVHLQHEPKSVVGPNSCCLERQPWDGGKRENYRRCKKKKCRFARRFMIKVKKRKTAFFGNVPVLRRRFRHQSGVDGVTHIWHTGFVVLQDTVYLYLSKTRIGGSTLWRYQENTMILLRNWMNFPDYLLIFSRRYRPKVTATMFYTIDSAERPLYIIPLDTDHHESSFTKVGNLARLLFHEQRPWQSGSTKLVFVLTAFEWRTICGTLNWIKLLLFLLDYKMQSSIDSIEVSSTYGLY